MEDVFPEFVQMFPNRFNNKTNGITQRLWLLKSNPSLSALVTDAIGDGWISAGTSLEELDEFLRKLHGFRAEYGREKEPFEIHNMGASAYSPDGIKQLEDRGVHEVIVAFRDVYKKQPDPSLDEKLATMRWYADNVIAKSR